VKADDFYKKQPVMITGGLGFLGSNLAHRLAGLGAELTIVDNFQPDHGANWRNLHGIEDKAKVYLRDIRNTSAMEQLVKENNIIFHIAGQTSHTDSMKNPFPDIDINCRGNAVLLEAVRKNNPAARIVYASTRAVYGAPVSVPVSESTLPCPVDIYGADKLAAEHYHLIYHRAHGIPVVALRFSNGYGPRAQIKHPKYGILNWFIGLILRGETIRVFGDGAQLRDYTYADDMVEAFLLAGMRPEAVGKVYNVAAREQIRFIDMVRTLIDVAGRGAFEMIPWPDEYKKIEVGDFAADSSLIETELGWAPKMGFETGLKKTFDFYRDNIEFYS
jgi:UDP-glucose 4-epimerase